MRTPCCRSRFQPWTVFLIRRLLLRARATTLPIYHPSQVLNMLQIWRPRNANLSATDVSTNMANAFKDISVGAIVSVSGLE